jgi:low affinity Fe/Cu permease
MSARSRGNETWMLQAERRGGAMPSDVEPEIGRFDRVAAVVVDFASRGRFLLVVLGGLLGWLIVGFFVQFGRVWLNCGVAGIAWITLLLVFAVENSNRRRDQALQRKLNAVAGALAEFMTAQDVDDRRVHELRAAVGLEDRESVD